MDIIKEALTFDDVTLAPNYSDILPSEVVTSTKLSKHLNLKIPLLLLRLKRAIVWKTLKSVSITVPVASLLRLWVICRSCKP